MLVVKSIKICSHLSFCWCVGAKANLVQLCVGMCVGFAPLLILSKRWLFFSFSVCRFTGLSVVLQCPITFEACRRAGIHWLSSPEPLPIWKTEVEVNNKKPNRIRSSPILADSSTTDDCYYVRQPCGKPFVGGSFSFSNRYYFVKLIF